MARLTVEDCLKNQTNRYELVLLAARRAKQIAHRGQSFIDSDNDKPTVVALREIAAGHVSNENIEELEKVFDDYPTQQELEQETDLIDEADIANPYLATETFVMSGNEDDMQADAFIATHNTVTEADTSAEEDSAGEKADTSAEESDG